MSSVVAHLNDNFYHDFPRFPRPDVRYSLVNLHTHGICLSPDPYLEIPMGVDLNFQVQLNIILQHSCAYMSPSDGVRWLNSRASVSGARGPGFETYLSRIVSVNRTLYTPKVLVIPR